MAKDILHSWLGRPITDPDHAQHLETVSAINEFHRNLPRHKAEEEAHSEYAKDQLHEAGAHHLSGMKAALAVSDHDAAKKHGIMYGLILKKLGHDVVGEPPSEIATKAKHLENPVYRFKAHRGDAFALPDKEDKKDEG